MKCKAHQAEAARAEPAQTVVFDVPLLTESAHWRDRVDRVLGSLHTLNSPYFEDRYYPEARVLEALIHFRTCRFPETLATVQRFLRDYKPLKKEVDLQLAGQRTDAEF